MPERPHDTERPAGEPIRVLLVEDSVTDAKLAVTALRALGRSIADARVEDEASLRQALRDGAWDVVLSDWSMPKLSALRALQLVKDSGLDLPFIIVSGTVGEEVAADAIRLGASDYVLKDRLVRLAPAVERELRERDDRNARRRAEEALRETEKQLRHSQKMEAVGRLAGGIAHDFNNMLSVILSYTEMLLAESTAGEQARGDLEEIRQAGLRAADLTRQLLLFSRQQVVEPKILDVNEVLSNMTKMLARVVGDDIELTWSPGPSLGHVRIDPGAMEQVIMNLAINARDAMLDGGRLTIATQNTRLGEEHARKHADARPGEHVVLSLADTGTGMDDATLARIFEPFFTTKALGKGTGLGLSTVFGIVKQAEGHVTVQSELGVGTTFRVYLPRVNEASDAHVGRPTPPGSALRGSETVLLVEDDGQVRSLVAIVLRRSGYRVLEAADGGEALRLCAQDASKIDLLLTDVVMPGMTGPELAARLVTLRPHTRVLFMSGYAPDTRSVGEGKTPVAYLRKPVTPASLTQKVREVLRAPRRT